MTQRLDTELFKSVVANTPLISVDLIVRNPQGQILLGLRVNRPAQGYWFVPGGRVQKDEPLAEAFARLTEAELGLSLPMTAGRFYGVWQHFYDDNFSDADFSTHYIVLGFRLQVDAEALTLPEAQHNDYRWMSPKVLLAADNVHENSRAYFRVDKMAEVPGL